MEILPGLLIQVFGVEGVPVFVGLRKLSEELGCEVILAIPQLPTTGVKDVLDMLLRGHSIVLVMLQTPLGDLPRVVYLQIPFVINPGNPLQITRAHNHPGNN